MPAAKVSRIAAPVCYCGKVTTVSEPVDMGGALNREAYCPDHGWQFTISTNTEARA